MAVVHDLVNHVLQLGKSTAPCKTPVAQRGQMGFTLLSLSN